MIPEIACDIKDLVLSSGYVNTHFEYCELIQRGEVVYPAQYVGGGNYEQVLNNDVNGNSYLRKNGNISISPITSGKKFKACGGNPFVTLTIPFRLVMVVPKDKLQDDAFSDDLLAQDMIRLLQSALQVNIYGVSSLNYNVTGYNVDSLSIWSEEIKGMAYQMNFAYSYIAINFNAVAFVNPACLIEPCPPY